MYYALSRVRRIGLMVGALLLVAACASPPADPEAGFWSWGTMREVLRNGESQGRVELANFEANSLIGVGALAGLAGEVTIVDGRVLVARGESGADPIVVEAAKGDAASLLVVASVPTWDPVPIGDCAGYDQLEQKVAAQLRERGLDPTEPQPIRVRGRASRLVMHVIAGACPIADPSGPPPWRFDGPAADIELVGFYVEGAAGQWTHHNHSSHLHAIAGDRLAGRLQVGSVRMGHLDEVALHDAVLWLPPAR